MEGGKNGRRGKSWAFLEKALRREDISEETW
jgi:hypothetical protein